MPRFTAAPQSMNMLSEDGVMILKQSVVLRTTGRGLFLAEAARPIEEVEETFVGEPWGRNGVSLGGRKPRGKGRGG